MEVPPTMQSSSSDQNCKSTFKAEKFRKGLCENCGAMTHNYKSCTDRPRKIGAKWTNKNIAADDEIITETIILDYDGKRDRWICDHDSTYPQIIEKYEARDEARRKYLKEKQSKQLDEEESKLIDEMDFSKVEKRVRTAGGGGSTGTVRNLRIREDTAKYLLNLDINSAYYDPRSRSMREDPLPDMDPNEKVYSGDNQEKLSGQALDYLQIHACREEFDNKGHYAPSEVELLYNNYKISKQKLQSQIKESIMEKYGVSV